MGRFDQRERVSRVADEHRSRSRSPHDRRHPDRRSRSPDDRRHPDRRSRSPVHRDGNSPATREALDPAAAAKAAAERISAQLKARAANQPTDASPSRPAGSVPRSAGAGAGASVTSEVYTQDGDYIKDIEINDLRNRYTLTKGPTQKMIKDETGADVTTRGEYYPDKSMATPSAPPLYLHITSTTKEGLEMAVRKIEEMMQQELPNLVDERRFRRREPDQVQRDEHGRRKWPEENIPIDLEPIPGFNLRAQVVGHSGAYVKHIQAQTGCRVQIKGRGSGYLEMDTGRETDEAMYLHVTGPYPEKVQEARELCLDLLDNVKQQYEQFKERGPRERQGGYYGNRERHHNNRDNDHSNHSSHQAQSQYPTGTSAAYTTADNAAAMQAWVNQYYGGQDPYAAYGGYEAYMQYWQYYQQQQAAAATNPTAASPPGVSSYVAPPSAPPTGYNQQNPPPPPPGEAPPPPPPSGSPPGMAPPSASPPGTSGYHAVPPPPGL